MPKTEKMNAICVLFSVPRTVRETTSQAPARIQPMRVRLFIYPQLQNHEVCLVHGVSYCKLVPIEDEHMTAFLLWRCVSVQESLTDATIDAVTKSTHRDSRLLLGQKPNITTVDRTDVASPPTSQDDLLPSARAMSCVARHMRVAHGSDPVGQIDAMGA